MNKFRKFLIKHSGYKTLLRLNKSTKLAFTISPDSISFACGFVNTKYGNKTEGGAYLSLFYFTISIDWEIRNQ